MESSSLSSAELTFLDEKLQEYGDEEAILCMSELDGFLTAIASSPHTIPHDAWLNAIWNSSDQLPPWADNNERKKLYDLIDRHLQYITDNLNRSEDDIPMLLQFERLDNGQKYYIAEDWCFGYMRGVKLSNWPELPEELNMCLALIEMHSNYIDFSHEDNWSIEQYQGLIELLGPAAKRLHTYWKGHSTSLKDLLRAPKAFDPESPCPCGSGKKFKSCCLN